MTPGAMKKSAVCQPMEYLESPYNSERDEVSNIFIKFQEAEIFQITISPSPTSAPPTIMFNAEQNKVFVPWCNGKKCYVPTNGRFGKSPLVRTWRGVNRLDKVSGGRDTSISQMKQCDSKSGKIVGSLVPCLSKLEARSGLEIWHAPCPPMSENGHKMFISDMSLRGGPGAISCARFYIEI